MTTKEHYDNHLGEIYSWMMGDFRSRADNFKKLLRENLIAPNSNKTAIDLGAGHGIQSIPLAEIGFNVMAVDFNQNLLEELNSNAKNLNITTINDDIRNLKNFSKSPELIVCGGDTLSHLESKREVETFIYDISSVLEKDGKIILSFRDYSNPLFGTDRFIPVRSDENRIMTCFLEYDNDHINVTDILQEKTNEGWKQKISSYRKVRLVTSDIINLLTFNAFKIIYNQINNRLTTIIATKP
ncbi:class I SAM-dependent methyltransferase [Marivirga sp. S37H4]|uniref:Class I SAM-dependent methyltransferase n=1 Tax=Marivirga aurantiaca TaxID=2802615 RepID=A0A934WYQ3_9BACT|nr:class I SAM-dependent methyltransferase [Marivirga aurantiaca]MBK6265275.1 class I SAM-dependent methyltransferase [Marivirga aurantiaca]